MREERLSVLKDNEDYCNKEEEKRKKGATSDDEDFDGFVDEVDDDDDDEDNDEVGTFENEDTILGKIAKVRANVKNGVKMDDMFGDEDEDDDDDENDSDYEFTGGDLAIYDSALDDVDELLFVKEQLERLNVQDQAYAQHLLSSLSQDEQTQFNLNMSTAQELKDKEELIRKRCDEIDKIVSK
jgi:hypothetical protein